MSIAANVPSPFKRVYSERERESGSEVVEKEEPSTYFPFSLILTCLEEPST